MELRHVRYFVAVAEELHFGRAARRLGISQPPLSQQIKLLEQEVGARLFARTRHKVELTRAGEATLSEAYRLLEQADRVHAVARHAGDSPVTRLRIGCIASVFFDILPPILDRIHARNPEISLSVMDSETTHSISGLLQGTLDVAFVRLDKVAAPLKVRAVMRDHFIAAIPQRHRLARLKKVPLTALADEPLAIYARRMSPHPYDRVIAACLKAGFSPNLAYESASIQAQTGVAACGLGIAVVPNLVRHWRVPRVVYRELDTVIEAPGVGLAWNAGIRSEPVEIFLRTTRQVFPASARR
jgi:DNA-binding transcriptional LysR family regulator